MSCLNNYIEESDGGSSEGDSISKEVQFFWGDFSDVKKISWIAWEKVLSPRNKGGIGIGRLSTSNHSLLAKWWWRFRTEEYALWCKVIRCLHGVSGGLIEDSSTSASSGPLSRIMKLKTDLNLIGIDLLMLFKKKVGNGQNTRFWHDNWLGGKHHCLSPPACLSLVTGPGRATSFVIHTTMGQTYLPNSFQPTPFGLSFNWTWIRRPYTVGDREILIILTNLLANLHLNAEEDIWEFTYGASRSFTTHCMRNLITLNSYYSNLQPTRWNKILPAKVNILSWRVWHRRIPTRLNLDCRGIDLDTVRCPVCDDDTESQEHIFIHCKASSDTWKAIFSRWKISGPPVTSVDDMI
uniref:RNA-directed DNA polymerase, eukaryota, reverse transcriptase zinc-binding domain protein n=1 Tax=Tanacetum cinerariifolium TaxID=118510 RepID=A0A699I6J4_TANCI|nr:RNA-directed DNA polymerase, eukaryota, reverse transcriptase zinc-binding domain protein [Tanacetum cinerariifolium]